MAASQPLKISGDPRRPSDARPYVAPEFNKEENPGDFRLIGSMMFGLAAMLTKIPWFGWVGILLNLNYFANMNYGEFDLKAAMSAVFFSVSGLIGSYISNFKTVK